MRLVLRSSRIQGNSVALRRTSSRESSVESPSTTMISYCSRGKSLWRMLSRQFSMYLPSFLIGMMIDVVKDAAVFTSADVTITPEAVQHSIGLESRALDAPL